MLNFGVDHLNMLTDDSSDADEDSSLELAGGRGRDKSRMRAAQEGGDAIPYLEASSTSTTSSSAGSDAEDSASPAGHAAGHAAAASSRQRGGTRRKGTMRSNI